MTTITSTELRNKSICLYTPPFRFEHGYIWDAKGQMVADNHVDGEDAALRVRGWGRISYMENPEALQDEVGNIIALAMTEFWERRKAAMDSEPVAWTSETALSDVACEETSMIGQEGVVGSIPLYRHAQQPVVETVSFDDLRDAVAEMSGGLPMEWDLTDLSKGHQAVPFINFNSLSRIVEKFRVTAQPAPVVPECFVRFHDIIKERHYGRMPEEVQNAYDECAAMLQAGNSPVIPDRWIPVSERMPEGSEEVLCAKEFDGPGDWRKKVGYLLAGKWTVYGASWTPTHWMPLPNSPQEQKS